MIIGVLLAALQKLRPLKAPVLVVAVSALLALLFTIATRPSASESPHPAGEAAMRLMNAEHDRVAASVQEMLAVADARQEADARSRAEMRRLAIADPAETPAVVVAKPGRAVLPAPRPIAAIEPPLQLQAVAAAQPERRRPVLERTRTVLATVGQIPHWLRAGLENAADWAVTAPVQALSRSAERHVL
jgi:hypothetical protein